MWPFLRMRRRRVLAQPFLPMWREILRARMAHYARLSEAERAKLEQLVQLLVAEKSWEGLGGLVLNDEIRVTIAGQACLLLLGFTREPERSDLYANVKSILVYPTTVVPKRVGEPIFGADADRGSDRAGAGRGALARAGDPDVGLGAARRACTRSSGTTSSITSSRTSSTCRTGCGDGTPPLASRAAYARWVEVCTREYTALRERIAQGEPTFLDPYAGTDESEFFAVATEHFFDQPEAMHARHPELYGCYATSTGRILRRTRRTRPGEPQPLGH